MSTVARARCVIWFSFSLWLFSVWPNIGAGAEPGSRMFVYVGTYTSGDSEGIYRFEFDAKTGELKNRRLAAKSDNPSFLALDPTGRFLYAVNEIGKHQGKPSGAVSGYAIDRDSGMLTLVNQQPSGGGAPCHLVVDKQGRHVLLANYSGGSVAVLPIDAQGRLGEATAFVQHRGSSVNPRRQTGPHAHSINLDAANRFAYAADLGLDRVLIYRFDSERGELKPNEPAGVSLPPGAGPRHFALHPSGRFAYVINEMQLTVTAFARDAERGALRAMQSISTLPAGAASPRYSTAEVQATPDGRFLYGSNRGHNSLAMFRIDQDTGELTALGHQPTGGETPRNFGIDPQGRFLIAANQGSDSLVVFRIDPQTGLLTPSGARAEAPSPVCVKFLAAP